jgi:hypothetical protein
MASRWSPPCTALALLFVIAGVVSSSARAQTASDSTAGGAAAPNPSGQSCGANSKVVEIPLYADAIEGTWVDVDTGALAVIEKTPGGNDTDFTLKARHEWTGSFDGGRTAEQARAPAKLTFKRKPKPEEMSQANPEWARKKVEGTLEWSLELDAKLRTSDCGTQDDFVLEGKWFPGEIKATEETDASGKITKQDASVIGKGKPIDIKYRAPKVNIQLLAQTVVGPVHVDYFFYGVPTVVEAIFDQPLADATVPVVLTVEGSEIKLRAKRDATDYRRFVTDTILPGEPQKPAGAKPP